MRLRAEFPEIFLSISKSRHAGFLLDTCAFLQATGASSTLSRKAKSILEDVENKIYVSVVVAWELELLAGRKRIALPMPPTAYVESRSSLLGFSVIDLSIYDVGRLPQIMTINAKHRNPFDHMLIAVAMQRDLDILTSDRNFLAYDVTVVDSKLVRKRS